MFGSKYWVVLVGFACFYVPNVYAQEAEYPTLNSSWAYCFEYTWFGPDYNEITGYNGTCDDYRDDYRAGDDIPCAPPLVISTDGTIPDVEYLWKNHKPSVLCRRSDSQACVTYTYWYKGLVMNQTHMCARVKTESQKVPLECYKQKVDGFEVELCICKGPNGYENKPCNSGAATYQLAVGAIFVAALTYILRNLNINEF